MVALTSFGRRCRRSAPKDLLHSHVSSFPDLLSPTTPTGTNCASAIAHSGCCNNSSQQTSPFPAGSSRLSQPNRVHLSLRSIWFFSLLPTPPHGDAVTSSSRQHIGCQRPRSLTLKEDAALQRTREALPGFVWASSGLFADDVLQGHQRLFCHGYRRGDILRGVSD